MPFPPAWTGCRIRWVAFCGRAAILGAALIVGALPAPGIAESDGALRDRIERRAACITHEGGDLPVGAPAPTAQQTAKADPDCAAPALDGTRCDALDGPAATACLATELKIWDGVLDRLLSEAGPKRRDAQVKGAIASFRIYRDKTCRVLQSIAINPSGESAVASCRIGESARFAQRLYTAYFSP